MPNGTWLHRLKLTGDSAALAKRSQSHRRAIQPANRSAAACKPYRALSGRAAVAGQIFVSIAIDPIVAVRLARVLHPFGTVTR